MPEQYTTLVLTAPAAQIDQFKHLALATGVRIAYEWQHVSFEYDPPVTIVPPPLTSFSGMTNRQVINLVYHAAGNVLTWIPNDLLNKMLVEGRDVPYTGPVLEDWPLSDAQKEAVKTLLAA